MKSNINSWQLIILFSFSLLFMVSCIGVPKSTEVPLPPTSTLSPTIVVINQVTMTEPVATKTVTPASTLALTQRPTSTVTITPTITNPPEPILIDSTWLLLSQYLGPFGGLISYGNPILTNVVGSVWKPLALPGNEQPGINNTKWMGDIAEQGGFVAFQNYVDSYFEDDAMNQVFNPNDHLVYIIKLPENRLVRKLPLYGREAFDQAKSWEFDSQVSVMGEAPPVFAVTHRGGTLLWSPDGRYLAYSAAPNSSTADVYLYDTLKDEVRRLTTDQNNASVMGWSPDSQWIIYRGLSRFSYEHETFLQNNGLYAVSITGEKRALYQPKNILYYLQWVSNTQFVVYDGCKGLPQSCQFTIHLLNVSGSQNEIIATGDDLNDFTQYLSDPDHHVVFIIFTSKREGMDPGIYVFKSENLTFTKIIDGDYRLNWSSKINRFVFYPNASDSPEFTIRYDGSAGWELVDIELKKSISPDGNWSFSPSSGKQDEYNIYDHEGNQVQKLIGDSCVWSSDSSLIWCIWFNDEKGEKAKSEFIIYRKSNNWDPFLYKEIPFNGATWNWKKINLK